MAPSRSGRQLYRVRVSVEIEMPVVADDAGEALDVGERDWQEALRSQRKSVSVEAEPIESRLAAKLLRGIVWGRVCEKDVELEAVDFVQEARR